MPTNDIEFSYDPNLSTYTLNSYHAELFKVNAHSFPTIKIDTKRKVLISLMLHFLKVKSSSIGSFIKKHGKKVARVEKLTPFSSFMDLALAQARLAFDLDEVPIGAVIVRKGEVIALSHNHTIHTHNPLGHAEILCLQKASSLLQTNYLDECDLYCTLEPCPMCAQAISLARIKRLYYGAYDPKGGGVDHGPKIYGHRCAFHKPEVYSGLLESQCSRLLKDFFKNKR